MADDSATRIQVALRSGMIAKAALEMLDMSPEIARLQINEVIRLVAETTQWLGSVK